ncbi:MAG TPA: S41 family peptidase, partial [Hyphomicrobiaceae bacterium]|nr:S41 family peptidase [Hyphomicrobiaceae bacterium]
KRRWFSAKGKPISAPPGPTSSQLLPGRWSSAAALGLLGPAAQHNITGSIIYGLIDGEIGYLNVRSLWWRRIPDLDDTLDKALALFQRARMVIVDVSVNGGGGEGLGMRVVERFAGARTLGFYKYAGDGRDEKPQPIFVVPSKKARFLGPAYVITSGETFSAAETLAMSMSVLPNVVHLGQPTAGALSDVLSRRLPNGWRVGLSNEIYLDVARKSWEGIGVPPTVGLEIRPDLKTASPGDLKAARAVLNAIIARAKSKATGRD